MSAAKTSATAAEIVFIVMVAVVLNMVAQDVHDLALVSIRSI